jgi:hypothetical protein
MGNVQDSHNAQAGYQGRNHVTFSSQTYASSYARDDDLPYIPTLALPSEFRIPQGVYNPSLDSILNKSPVSLPSSDEAVTVTCYHVSCQSDKWKADEVGIGIVLYSYKGKSDWYLNGIHCKSGYIVYKLLKNIKHLPGLTSHEQCFRSVFGTSAKTSDPDLIGAGFAYKPGIGFENRSGTFNQHIDKIHHVSSKDRELHALEFKWIKKAMENWKKGIQNTKVSSDSVSGWQLHHDLQ